jgi:sortase A
VLTRAGAVLVVLGLMISGFLAYEFGLGSLAHDRSQLALQSAFRRAVVTTTLDAPGTSPTEGSAVALLKIPALGLDQVVVEGTNPTDLQSGPGLLRSSPFPGEYGNAVIVARRTTYGGPFGRLDQLRRNDVVRVATGQGSFTYLVKSVMRVHAGQRSPMSPTADSRLTLVTSDPSFLATGRLVVVAALQGRPLSVPKASAFHPSVSELGLVGDPAGLWLGLVWAAALGAAVWLTLRLRTQLPHSVRVMFAAPVVVGLALLAFSSADRFLPGTL